MRAARTPAGRGSAWTTEFSVMWFVAALLVFSLAYASLDRHAVRGPGDEISGNGRAEYGHRLTGDPVRAPGRHGRGRLVTVVRQLGPAPVAQSRPAARQDGTGLLCHLPHPPARAHHHHGAARSCRADTRDRVRAGGHSGSGRLLPGGYALTRVPGISKVLLQHKRRPSREARVTSAGS